MAALGTEAATGTLPPSSGRDHSPIRRNQRNARDPAPLVEYYSKEWVGPIVFESRIQAAPMPLKFYTHSHIKKYTGQFDMKT